MDQACMVLLWLGLFPQGQFLTSTFEEASTLNTVVPMVESGNIELEA